MIALMLLFAICGYAHATPIVFTDRDSWSAAVGGSPDFYVDFEKYSEDAVFGRSPLNLGFFGLVQTTGIPNLFNRIDVPPYYPQIGPLNSPNGSTAAFFVVSSGPNTTEVAIYFPRPMFAFGADFRAGAPDSRNLPDLQLVLNTDSGTSILGVESNDGFYGFVSDDSFTRIGFRMNSTHSVVSFGLDNVVGFGQTRVPEPPTLALLTITFLGLSALRRRRAS